MNVTKLLKNTDSTVVRVQQGFKTNDWYTAVRITTVLRQAVRHNNIIPALKMQKAQPVCLNVSRTNTCHNFHYIQQTGRTFGMFCQYCKEALLNNKSLHTRSSSKCMFDLETVRHVYCVCPLEVFEILHPPSIELYVLLLSYLRWGHHTCLQYVLNISLINLRNIKEMCERILWHNLASYTLENLLLQLIDSYPRRVCAPPTYCGGFFEDSRKRNYHMGYAISFTFNPLFSRYLTI